MSAGVIEQVLGVAARTMDEMPTECGGATGRDRAQSADVTGQDAPTVLGEVVGTVLAHDLGETRHGGPCS
jgi:hypothetical protein